MVKWDDSKPGFVGDDNIYGLGIRVGYYTQVAVSIWVANFYARHEAPYLHTLTLLFLFALFVGVCQMSGTPSGTYAVEPFMLISIAYHTFYLVGLWDPEPPYRLRWETQFQKQAAVTVIWLAFAAFEAWYWWKGVWQMKPSDGPIGTVIFFPYVGNTPLFGPDQWISIAAKVLNAIVLTLLTISFICLSGNTLQQRQMDLLITPERLRSLGSRWIRVLGGDFARSDVKPIAAPSKAHAEVLDKVEPVQQASASRSASTDSSNQIADDAEQDDKVLPIRSPACSDGPPSYRRPTRTGTGLLKTTILRRFSNKDFDLSTPPPDYVLYEPTFEQLNMAYNMLKDTTSCTKRTEIFKGASYLKVWLHPVIWTVDLALFLCIQPWYPWRPKVLLAIRSHASTLRFGCSMTYPTIFRLALRHPSYRAIKSKDLVLASRIIFSTEPPVKPTRGWQLAMGYAMLGACSVLVIGTELTIQWNKITGVQNLASVGQLIPFTLGVGSLLKIVWSAIVHRGTKADQFCYYNYCVKTSNRDVWEEAGKKFLDCRDADTIRRTMVIEEETEDPRREEPS